MLAAESTGPGVALPGMPWPAAAAVAGNPNVLKIMKKSRESERERERVFFQRLPFFLLATD